MSETKRDIGVVVARVELVRVLAAQKCLRMSFDEKGNEWEPARMWAIRPGSKSIRRSAFDKHALLKNIVGTH